MFETTWNTFDLHSCNKSRYTKWWFQKTTNSSWGLSTDLYRWVKRRLKSWLCCYIRQSLQYTTYSWWFSYLHCWSKSSWSSFQLLLFELVAPTIKLSYFLIRFQYWKLWTLHVQWLIYNFGLMGPGTCCFLYQWVQMQTYESRTLFLMTILQFTIASWASLKSKLCIPETKLCAKDAGCAGNKITARSKNPQIKKTQAFSE